jgi:hypothetical protein
MHLNHCHYHYLCTHYSRHRHHQTPCRLPSENSVVIASSRLRLALFPSLALLAPLGLLGPLSLLGPHALFALLGPLALLALLALVVPLEPRWEGNMTDAPTEGDRGVGA